MVVDLARRTYFRLEGKGPLKTVSRGSIDEFDALVLMTEQYPVPTLSGRLVIYRLVFYWKESREPLLIAAREEKTIKRSDPLNAGSGALRVSGEQFARLMGVPFFDNSWFHSKKPLPPV
jgi:hypothetical protein